MAFASSRIGVQEAIIKHCDLCEDDDDVNWFCKECVQYLCERCKKAHLKTAICKDHRIVTVLEGVAIIKRNISNACQDHGEHFTFYCRTCEDNICAICLAIVHKGHDFIDLRNLHSELQSTLENVIKKKEDEQMKLTIYKDELENLASHCRDTLTIGYATIEDRMKAIHTAVDDEGGRLKETLKIAVHKQIKEVEERQRKVEGLRYEYDEKINTVKQELTLQTTSTFGQFVEISTSKLQSLVPITYSITMDTRLTAGRTRQDLIMDMIGKIDGQLNVRESQKDVKKGEISIFSEIHIIQIHKLDLQKNCLCICRSPDGSIWIGGAGFVYNFTSDLSTILHKIPTIHSCANIACLQSGDAVASFDESPYIERFTSDGRRLRFMRYRIHHTHGITDIAVTNRDEVLVLKLHAVNKIYESFFQIFNSVEPAQNHFTILDVYSNQGKPLNRITLDITNNESAVCINNDGNCVISEKGSRCLSILDKNHTVTKKIQISKPGLLRMTCDKYGNILGIPAGAGVKNIYLVSDDGQLERSYPVECNECINGICIDNDRRLLILVDYRRVIVAKYLE